MINNIKNNYIFFSISLYLLLIFNVKAQNTIINGFVPNGKGKKVEILKVSDYITGKKIKVKEAIIDSTLQFSVKLNITEVQLIKIRIEYGITELYVEPDRTYYLGFYPLYQQFPKNFNPFLSEQKLDFVLFNSDSLELNAQIAKFNNEFKDFLSTLKNAYELSRNYYRLNELRIKYYNDFNCSDSSFLKDYINYRVASLELLSKSWDTYYFINRYFKNTRVRYENPEYMDLFNDTFKEFLISTSKFVSRYDLLYTINSLQSYQSVTDSIGKDSLLVNEEVREVVLLKSLKEFYASKQFDPLSITKILNFIKQNSKFPQNRAIAANILSQNSYLKANTKAPNIKIPIDNGKFWNLDSLKGKFVYLNFFTSNCFTCQAEFKILEKIYEKNKKDLEVVSISLDLNTIDFTNFINQNKYKWKIIHFANNYEMVTDYDIRDFPLYILLDKNGNIIQFPARLPSENMEIDIQNFLRAKNIKKSNKVPGTR